MIFGGGAGPLAELTLPEQILLRRPHHLPRGAVAATILVPPDYTSRNARIFAAHQTCDARQFVGHSLFRGVHLVTVGIALAAIIVDHLHPRNADGDVAQTLAPGAPEAVRNDH